MKILSFPFDAGRGGILLFLSSLRLFKIIIYSFDALRPRGGPYFLLLQKVGKDRRKGVSPPCESPDQSGVLDAPLWKPPSPRWRGNPGRTPRRFAAGASVPLGKAASACALATAAAPPPLRVGGFTPLPPKFPVGERLPVMRACWGLRPLPPKFPVGGRLPVMRACWGLTPPCPKVPRWGTFAGYAHLLGAAPPGPRVPQRGSSPIMRASAWYRVRFGFCGQRPRKSPGSSCRAAARSSVTPLARLWPQATLARPQRGNPKGGAALFGQSLPTFCWPESRGPARPERVEGIKIKFNRRKEDKRSPGAASPKKAPLPRRREKKKL